MCQTSLVNAGRDKEHAAFKLTTKTSNALINMTFTASPARHSLHWEASTSNGPVHATLDGAYQGDIYLATSPYTPPFVRINENARDPEHMGRQRVVRLDHAANLHRPGTVEGTVRWGSDSEGDKEKGGAKGSVEITTSNASITLVV